MIQQNASAAEEMASTAEEMTSQAEQLVQTMEFFRIGESTARAASRGPAKPRRAPQTAKPVDVRAATAGCDIALDARPDDRDADYERY